MSLHRLMWEVAQERGTKSELAVEKTLATLGPPNVLSWRRATPKEDRNGIDFVVETPVGPLFLQVKSSQTGAAKFLERPRKTRIEVVVASRDVRSRLLHAISMGIRAIRKKRAREAAELCPGTAQNTPPTGRPSWPVSPSAPGAAASARASAAGTPPAAPP